MAKTKRVVVAAGVIRRAPLEGVDLVNALQGKEEEPKVRCGLCGAEDWDFTTAIDGLRRTTCCLTH